MLQSAFEHILQGGHCFLAGGLQVSVCFVHPGQETGGEQVSRAGERCRQPRNVDADAAASAI